MLVVSRPDLAVLVVQGADRQTWLNGLLTCDLAKAKPGSVTYGLAVGQKGRILADVVVVLLEDHAKLVVPAAKRESLKQSLEKYLIMEDAEVSLGDDAVAMACGAEWRSLEGQGATVLEYDPLGLGGALILGSVAGVTMAGVDAWEALRVERGVPRFGADFDETTYPQEASLEKRAVSFDKGCYLGQEVVCMLELRGHVKRKLVPVTIDRAEPPKPGSKVTDETGAEVGVLTSSAVGPSSKRAVGLAMLKLAKAEAGTKLMVDGASVSVS